MAASADPDTLVDTHPTVRVALELGAAALGEAGIEGGRVDAEWLLAEALGIARGRLGLHGQQPVEPSAAARYVQALRRRIGREPLQHIVGIQAFRDLTLRVSRDALVPRPETELLAGWALELLPAATAPLAIDVGTGSGCIACALASERPDVRVLALDLSPGAVGLARDNVAALGLAARVTVETSDLFATLEPLRADLIVSNPPYLPSGLIPTLAPEVSRHDPRLALDGGPDGLAVIRRLVDAAPRWLVPGGRLVLETGGDEQTRDVVALMSARGFTCVETRPDLAGVVRFVAGGISSCQHV
jgi:release factor glutamine methyltransferase